MGLKSVAVISIWGRALITLCVLGASAAPTVSAQQSRARSDDPRGTSVLLVVRPRVGDTLQLQMEQTISVGRSLGSIATGAPVPDGTRTPPTRETAPDFGPRQTRATLRLTRLVLYAHSVVEAGDLAVTTLLATTDSMAMSAGSPADSRTPTRLTLPVEGRQVRVRVTPDGAMRVPDPPPGAIELGATLAGMPGMLPSDPVRVGDVWERDIVLPSLPVSGYRADGVVRARFRLDSLTHGERDAWISLEGTMRRDGPAGDLPAGTRVITAGTMRGLLVVDRQRAWIVDARTVMDVRSEVSPGPGLPTAPLGMDLRIQQRVRVR